MMKKTGDVDSVGKPMKAPPKKVNDTPAEIKDPKKAKK